MGDVRARTPRPQPIQPNGGVGFPHQQQTPLTRPHAVLPAAPAAPKPVTYSPTGIVQTQPPPQPAPDPRDSAYGQGVASLLRRNAFERGDVTQQGVADRSNFDVGLQRLARARSQDLLGATSSANRSGLLYSSVLGKQRGGIEQDYLNRENDSRQALAGREAARTTALERLGTVTADASSPFGYTGTNDAGDSLFDLATQAVERRRLANQDVPVATPESPAPASAPVPRISADPAARAAASTAAAARKRAETARRRANPSTAGYRR